MSGICGDLPIKKVFSYLVNPIHLVTPQWLEFYRQKRPFDLIHLKRQVESMAEAHDIVEL